MRVLKQWGLVFLGWTRSASTTALVKAALDEGALYNAQWVREVLDKLDRKVFIGNTTCFRRLIQRCASLNLVLEGKRTHVHIIKRGFLGNVDLGTRVVQMYIDFGSLSEARRAFNVLKDRDLTLWTTMITAYAQHGNWQEALQLFELMEANNVIPGRITYVAILNAYAYPDALTGGKMIHGILTDNGFEADEIINSSLVNMYGKCGNLQDAQRIFDKLRNQILVSWNALVSAFTQHGHFEEALRYFRKMILNAVKPDKISFAAALWACAGIEDLKQGRFLHLLASEVGCECDGIVCNSLIQLYGRCGNLEDAERIFEWISERDVAVWATMVKAYSKHGRCSEGNILLNRLLHRMKAVVMNRATCIAMLEACGNLLAFKNGMMVHAKIISQEKKMEMNVYVGAAIIDMYGRCGSIEGARTMFNRMEHRGLQGWNSAIAAYAKLGYAYVALGLFQQMQLDGLNPNSSTLVSVLSACVRAGLVDDGVAQFSWMRYDFGVLPNAAHNACMMKLLKKEDIASAAVAAVEKDEKCCCAIWIGDEIREIRADDEEEDDVHSVRKAIALGIRASSTSKKTLRMINNFRVCKHCHTQLKLVSEEYSRHIVLRDGEDEYHVFRHGRCSCQDIW